MDGADERLYPSHHFLSLQRGCSSVDRVLASEAKGRGFDPRQPRHPFLSFLPLALQQSARSPVVLPLGNIH